MYAISAKQRPSLWLRTIVSVISSGIDFKPTVLGSEKPVVGKFGSHATVRRKSIGPWPSGFGSNKFSWCESEGAVAKEMEGANSHHHFLADEDFLDFWFG